MNFKKTALASAIALALSSGAIWAETTTVDGAFILDKTTVKGGDVVNLSLLGLNKNGEVDLYGEQKGAVIIAVVRSEIGEVIGGDTDPGEQASEEVAGGSFAADVKYIKLKQGVGRVHLQYDAETKGTDRVEVILQERTANPSGGVAFNEIARTIKNISVVQAESSNPLGLDIVAFTPSSSDTRGKKDCIGYGGRNESCIKRDDDGNTTEAMMPNDGIKGAMTASKEGGKVYVEAINPIAVGTVTVTLRKKATGQMNQCPQPEDAEPISYTASMQKGKAVVTLDSKVVKAGTYYVEATFASLDGEAFEGNSVDLFYSDTVMVYGTGIPSGLVLCSDKTVVAKAEAGTGAFPAGKQVAQGTRVKAVVVDEFGNVTSNNSGSNVRISVQDSNGIFSNTALNLTIPDGAIETIASDESGPGTDSVVGNAANEIAMVGTTSLIATAVDSAGTPLTGIDPSAPLELKVVADSLEAKAVAQDATLGIKTFNTSQLAGTEFDAFTVYITDGQGKMRVDSITGKPADPGAVTIKTSAGELLTVNRKNETPYHVQALFKKATDKGTYLVGDALGNFGQVIVNVAEADAIRLTRGITEAGILPAAATVVELQNAHGIKQGTVNPGAITTEEKFETSLYEASFKMFDDYGNSVTGVQPLTEDNTGTFRVTSANAAQVVHPPRGYGIPGRVEANGQGEVAKVIYDTDGEGAFAGEDTINITFTKPGLGVDGLSVKTTVPKPHTQATIKSYIEKTVVPVNSIVAMTVELTDETGSPFSGATEAFVTFEVNTATDQFVEGLEVVTPKVSGVYWVDVLDRPEIKCKEAGGIFDNDTSKSDNGGNFIGTCKEVRRIPVTNGESLNFTPIDPTEPVRLTPPSSKVFAIQAGAIEGQFSLTFYNSGDPEGEKETRVFTVKRNLIGKEDCDANGDLWIEEEEKCSVIPPIGTGTGVNAAGEPITTTASFKGGVQVGAGNLETLVISDEISITSDLPNNMLFAGSVTFGTRDIGKKADILAAVIYELAPPLTGSLAYYLTGFGELNNWDGQIAGLSAYGEPVEIKEDALTMTVPLYDGPFTAADVVPGVVKVYLGYRLENGDVKYGDTPIILDMKP